MSERIRISHFSAGACSAAAAMLGKADALVYADTSAEHPDNDRFLREVAAHMGLEVIRVKSTEYADTWDVWERTRFIANRFGAPCARELKLKPLAPYEQAPNSTHLIGYHAGERHRARRLELLKPDVHWVFPLIETGITGAGALGLLKKIGIDPPVTYSMGLPHANCIPCPKATSAAYWALIRREWPQQFERMKTLEQKLLTKGAQGIARHKGERVTLAKLPDGIKATGAVAPSCDLLCEAARV